jgi:murein L,D-transpeptidase YafK
LVSFVCLQRYLKEMMKNCNCFVYGGLKGFLFALGLFVFCSPLKAQDARNNFQRPRDVQIVKEYKDDKGRFVRVLKYKQGAMIVTEEIYMTGQVSFNNSLYPKIDPDTLNTDSLVVIVDKSKYYVQLLYKKKPIRRYKAVFGPKPMMNKCMEGDRCTPEGWFTIKHKNPNSKYDKFMLLDYPNDSARVRFNTLKEKGVIPASALIGGDIGIHGIWQGGDDMIEMGVGWTDGCVALKNKDIEELFSLVGVGTRVFIRK